MPAVIKISPLSRGYLIQTPRKLRHTGRHVAISAWPLSPFFLSSLMLGNRGRGAVSGVVNQTKTFINKIWLGLVQHSGSGQAFYFAK